MPSSVRQPEKDWTGFLNKRYGSQTTRRNVAIYVPIVTDFTLPVVQYNDGTVNPPNVVTEWGHTHPSAELLRNSDIHYSETTPGGNAFGPMDTNPNYKGDGRYFPEYTKHGVLYDYPEWDGGKRQPTNKSRKEFPLEIRRRGQF